MAIDITDETLHTDIRKKYFSLLLEDANRQQAQNQDSSTLD